MSLDLSQFIDKNKLKEIVKKNTAEINKEVDEDLLPFVEFFNSKPFGCELRSAIKLTELILGKKIPFTGVPVLSCIKNGEKGRTIYLTVEKYHGDTRVVNENGNLSYIKIENAVPATEEEIDKFFEKFKLSAGFVRSFCDC